MDLRPGQIVADRFRLEHELGRGGMGSVWRAHHVALDMPCAVKFIHGSEPDREDLRDRFRREAQAAAKLRCPHVVQMLDFGVWEKHPYIAMELLVGESLGTKLQRQLTLSIQETIAIAHDVGQALSRAAELGIVHRDLKPDNIFLVMEGARSTTKVLDFGIAKTSATVSRLTKTGAILGTPHYMSPEQAHGNRPVDGRSDLWSLAVVIFQCLTGRCPYEGDALGELIYQIMSGQLPMPSDVKSGLPPDLDRWWRRAVACDPKDRFQTPAELVGELEAALLGRADSIPTAVDGTRLASESVSRFDTDPAPANMATSGTLISVDSPGFPTILEPTTFEGQAAPSTPRAPRSFRLLWPAVAAAALTVGAGAWLFRIDYPESATQATVQVPSEPTASAITAPVVAPTEAVETAAPAAKPSVARVVPTTSASTKTPVPRRLRPRLPRPKPTPALQPKPAPAPEKKAAVRLSDPGY